jgi:hypothetical protein
LDAKEQRIQKLGYDPKWFVSEENEWLEMSGSRLALKRFAEQTTNTNASMPRWEAHAVANEKNCLGDAKDAEHLSSGYSCFQR